MEDNKLNLWLDKFPVKTGDKHKYEYGHALVYGAPEMIGATRLAATACARIGAGLVTVLAEDKVADLYRVALPPHLIVRNDLYWLDRRVNARLYGPGGISVPPDYKDDIPTVLDADALRYLSNDVTENYVLTPHHGEFKRTFPDISGSHIEKAQAAAKKTGAHIVLKGGETVICAPNGRTVLNKDTTPYLATAGTGDVLAGMITGLLAQGMPPFEAACASCWIHSECAKNVHYGLVASDLIDMLPIVMKNILD